MHPRLMALTHVTGTRGMTRDLNLVPLSFYSLFLLTVKKVTISWGMHRVLRGVMQTLSNSICTSCGQKHVNRISL